MTLIEKVNMTRGHTGTCVGNTQAIERLGIKSMCFADAPDGIRGQEFVSSFPAQLTVGATFDRDLMYRYGKALGEEYRGKGINVALLPVGGPLGRVARGGRVRCDKAILSRTFANLLRFIELGRIWS